MPSAHVSARTAADLARVIRGGGGTTCCCHICVDDPNYDDAHVAFCIMTAARMEHATCLRLALTLARCSYTQRRKVNRLAWE
ncbi:MAG TPA: hypothetical protein VGR82_17640 [Methylomirabilota bacterium]|jgi:hypothetical protein|nr:hypothetical protein [Methylomirabilota bacterium]